MTFLLRARAGKCSASSNMKRSRKARSTPSPSRDSAAFRKSRLFFRKRNPFARRPKPRRLPMVVRLTTDYTDGTDFTEGNQKSLCLRKKGIFGFSDNQ